MRTSYQTIPSGRGNATRGRNTRLRTPRIRTGPLGAGFPAQSQENLPFVRFPPSQIPRATDSPASRPASFHTGGSSPQSPDAEPVPGAPLRVWMREGESDTAQEPALSPSSHSSLSNPLVLEQSAESAEPVTAPESPTEPSDMDCDTSVGDDPQHSDSGLHLKEDDESLRAVSHSSTVFFDAPGSLASRLGSFMSDIEEQPPTADVVVLPTLDAKDGRSPERQPAFSQARLAPESRRDVSSNYSASGMLSSTASPTTPRSPVISPERLREELPYEVDTLRQRLFSHCPSGVFGSSTWEQSEDLDLTSLGRLSVENTSVEGRVRLSSEELTVIQGNRSMSLESRPVSIRGSQTIPPSRSSTLRSGHMTTPVPLAISMPGRWHDGPADASAAASETRTLGGQPSTTETCTITSTQAIKSRTFSSPSGSEISAVKASVNTSRATERSQSCEPLSPSDKVLSTICTSDAPVVEGMNNATGDMQTLTTDTTTSRNSAAGGVAGWVKRVWERYSPAVLKKNIARLLSYTGTKGREGGEAGGGRRGTRFKRREGRGTRSRKSKRSNRRILWRGWRVRMPWARRREGAPLLVAGSTEEYVHE